MKPWEVASWWQEHKHDPAIEAILDRTANQVQRGPGLLLYCAGVSIALIALGRLIKP